MPTQIIYEDAFVQVIEETSVVPVGQPGGWKAVRSIDKAGSPNANRETLRTKGTAALASNATYLASAAYPAGAALTTTQLTTIVRAQRVQIDLLTKQCNALIRLALGLLDTVSDT